MQTAINGFWFLPRKTLKFLGGLAVVLSVVGCSDKEEPAPVEQLQGLQLSEVSYAKLDGWRDDDLAQIIQTFAHNCEQISKKQNALLSEHSEIKIKTADMQQICDDFSAQNIATSADMRRFMEAHFVPYLISDGENADGKFTSYYEAEIRAATEPDDVYKYPIYARPNDLVEVNLKDFAAELPDMRLSGRVENGKLVPYFNRQHIENNAIDAPVLLWGDDLVDIHFMQIQGSAVAALPDGTLLRIGYAHNNGRPFKGIGRILLDKGLIAPQDVSMPNIRAWLRAHPEQAAELMAENERFIFHRITNADGPIGAFGLPLTAGRSLAVDKQYVPLGSVMWLDTVAPDNEKIRKVVFAQDIGSAIKGVVRGDYFWGHGEEALLQAGRMNSVGRYYIFLPKAKAAHDAD